MEKKLLSYLALMIIVLIAANHLSKKELSTGIYLTGEETMIPINQSEATDDSSKMSDVDSLRKFHRFFMASQNASEQKDLDERKKILESIFSKAKSIVRSSENKTAASILNVLSDKSAICIAEPLGLRFVEREELVDSGVGVVVFKGGEKILFPQWRKVRSKLQAGIMYDKEYNCIVIFEDSLHGSQFKAVRLLHEGNKILFPQIVQKEEFKLYEFENDIWRGLYGTRYSVLIEREADWIKSKIDSENQKVGDYYPLGTQFADELEIYMGEPVSSKEAEDREFRFRIYATFDMLDRYYKVSNTNEKKMLFLKNLAKQ